MLQAKMATLPECNSAIDFYNELRQLETYYTSIERGTVILRFKNVSEEDLVETLYVDESVKVFYSKLYEF